MMSLMRTSKLGGQMGGQSGIGFTLEYLAVMPVVRWGESERDVKPWDWTRCLSLGQAGGGTIKAGGLSAFKAHRRMKCHPRAVYRFRPILSCEIAGGCAPFFIKSSEKISAKRLHNGKPHGYVIGPFFGAASPKPVVSLEYPRLVRAHPYKGKQGLVFPIHRVFVDLWKKIEKDNSGSVICKPGKHFKKAVLDAIPKIGLIDPNGGKDTLKEWWEQALKVHILLYILGWLETQQKMNKEKIITTNDWIQLCKNNNWIHWDYERQEFGYQESKARDRSIEDKSWVGYEIVVNNFTGTPKEVKKLYAEHLLELAHIPKMLQALGTRFSPNKVQVMSGSGYWSMLELSNLFENTQNSHCKAPDCPIWFSGRGYSGCCSKTCQGRIKKRDQRSRKNKTPSSG